MITRARFLSLLLTVAAVVSAPVLAQQNLPTGKWQAGRHYRVVSPPQATGVSADKVEVIEIFWYGCGACFVLDPYLETWKKSKPAHVEFVRVPVTWNAGAKLHARLYYTLQALKQDDRLHTKVFDSIHRGGNGLLGRDEGTTLPVMLAWAKQNGIEEKAFTDAWNSMWVNTRLRQADETVRRYRAEGTPFMVINGKYTTDVGSAGGIPQMLNLINDLANAEKRR
ncbi:MAG: thiol:disulfide interchange protein DsbA/DsbL [Gammaproteobacteria bacterium]|nr:thiol:disulfide interchange protein DsbA/DsbL [Gammaproteobacteria bacterium]